jgi:hypothetical protein
LVLTNRCSVDIGIQRQPGLNRMNTDNCYYNRRFIRVSQTPVKQRPGATAQGSRKVSEWTKRAMPVISRHMDQRIARLMSNSLSLTKKLANM